MFRRPIYPSIVSVPKRPPSACRVDPVMLNKSRPSVLTAPRLGTAPRGTDCKLTGRLPPSQARRRLTSAPQIEDRSVDAAKCESRGSACYIRGKGGRLLDPSCELEVCATACVLLVLAGNKVNCCSGLHEYVRRHFYRRPYQCTIIISTLSRLLGSRTESQRMRWDQKYAKHSCRAIPTLCRFSNASCCAKAIWHV